MEAKPVPAQHAWATLRAELGAYSLDHGLRPPACNVLVGDEHTELGFQHRPSEAHLVVWHPRHGGAQTDDVHRKLPHAPCGALVLQSIEAGTVRVGLRRVEGLAQGC